MRKKVFSAVLACGLLAVVTAISASAQMPGTTLHATIPFDFIVRGRVLPAGNYVIRRLNDEPEGLVIFSVNDKRERAIFETESVDARQIPRTGELVFHRYGDSYFLSEVFAAGELTGRELPRTRQERSMRREMASNKAEPETVALAVY